LPIFSFIIIFTAIGVYESCQRVFSTKKSYIFNRKIIKLMMFAAIVSNALFFLFSGFIHKSGSLRLFDYLRANSDDISSIVFFTECHQTPYYSFLHKFLKIIFIFYNKIIINNVMSIIKRYFNEISRLFSEFSKKLCF